MPKDEIDLENIQTTEESRAALAQAMGVPASEIEVENPMWLEKLQWCVLVEIHAHRWRSQASLSWSELGLSEEFPALEGMEFVEEAGELLEVGYKRLLPADLMRRAKSLDTAARNHLQSRGVESHWGTMIPVTGFSQYRDEFEERYRQPYLALARRIGEHWERILEEVLAGYREIAGTTWDRMQAQAEAGLWDQELPAREEFIEVFLTRVRALIPPRDQVVESFRMEAEWRFVPLPQMLEADRRAADRVRQQRELERLEYELNRDALEVAGEEKRAALRELNREMLAQARRRQEQLVAEFARYMAQIRGTLYRTAVKALEAIDENGYLPGRSAASVRDLMDVLQRMDVYGDVELETLVQQVQGAMQPAAGEERDYDELRQALEDLAVVCAESLNRLNVPRYLPRRRVLPSSEAALETAAADARQRRNLLTEVEVPAGDVLKRRRIEEPAEMAAA